MSSGGWCLPYVEYNHWGSGDEIRSSGKQGLGWALAGSWADRAIVPASCLKQLTVLWDYGGIYVAMTGISKGEEGGTWAGLAMQKTGWGGSGELGVGSQVEKDV